MSATSAAMNSREVTRVGYFWYFRAVGGVVQWEPQLGGEHHLQRGKRRSDLGVERRVNRRWTSGEAPDLRRVLRADSPNARTSGEGGARSNLLNTFNKRAEVCRRDVGVAYKLDKIVDNNNCAALHLHCFYH